jgi:hypothetical protein
MLRNFFSRPFFDKIKTFKFRYIKFSFHLLTLILIFSNQAEASNKKFNPFTSKPDYIGTDSLSDISDNSGNCSSGEVIEFNGVTFECQADDSTAGGGTLRVSEDGTFIVSADTVDFRTGLKATLVTGTKVMVSGDMATTTAPGIASFDSTQFTVGPFGGVSITGGVGDITSVGDVASGAAFDGTQGDVLTFNDADGDETLSYDTTNNRFELSEELGFGGDTGATLDSASGALTFAGIGNSNNESLTLNLETTANQATWSSGTGILTHSFYSDAVRLRSASAAASSGMLAISGSASTSSSLNGILVSMTNSNASTGPTSGGNFTSIRSSATGGNASTLFGVKGIAQYSSTGTQVDAFGVYGDCQKITSASGVITDCYSIYGDAPDASGGGSITNSWAGGFNGNVSVTGDVTILGDNIEATTETDRFVFMANGSTYAPESIDLGTDTTGNYSAGDAEAGNALAGDSATSFFSTGTLEIGIGGTGLTSVSNDAVLVGNNAGTAYDQPALPSCSDPTTSKLLYNNSTNAFSCGSDQSSAGGTDAGMPDKDYWWPASATLPLEAADSIPPISKSTGTNIDQLNVLFDSATDECRTMNFSVPASIDTTKVATFRVDWRAPCTSCTTPPANVVVWDFRHNGGVASGSSLDASLTTISLNSTADTASADVVVAQTNTLVSALGWAVSDDVVVVVCRDANHASDTVSYDATAVGFGVSIPRA